MPGESRLRPRNLGASIWLDGNLCNDLGGKRLSKLVGKHGITGVRFNLTGFEDAISKGEHHQNEIAVALARGLGATEIYNSLLTSEVGKIAKQLEPAFRETEGRDGFVALPLPAELAHDLEALVEEATATWTAVNQQNLMILAPATEEGIGAFRQLIAAGINAGVTQLYNMRRYREVWEVYLAGMERRLSRECPVRHVASVAEFSLGTLHRAVDELSPPVELRQAPWAEDLAIVTARVAYGWYQYSVHSNRFQNLADAGAVAQRLAWSPTNGPDGLLARRGFPDEVLGPATVCELPARTIRSLERRSLRGTGVRYGIEDAQFALQFLDTQFPELEQWLAREMERLISKRVLHTDQAIASLARQGGPSRPKPHGEIS